MVHIDMSITARKYQISRNKITHLSYNMNQRSI
ncbi:hypothetical protein vBEcoMWL3_gp227 [Escherichia phage vB_EcoM_WL-3]|nr:hypothetical protein vBEcoMWL3_gp227 [Escherichia phage vB_EcoM_WL-3]